MQTSVSDKPDGPPLDRAAAERLVRNGDVPVAIVIPSGLGAAFARTGIGGGPSIALLADPSDPIAPNMVAGLLQKVTMTAAPDLLMQGGIRAVRDPCRPADARQRAAVDQWLPTLQSGRGGAGGGGAAMGVGVDVVDVMRNSSQRGSLISFYAAGIGVMFLLFSMVGAAGSVLLDEVESGTLERSAVHQPRHDRHPDRQVGVPGARLAVRS